MVRCNSNSRNNDSDRGNGNRSDICSECDVRRADKRDRRKNSGNMNSVKNV